MSGARILIIGANGQIGSELAGALSKRPGVAQVVTSDVAPVGRNPGLPHEQLDVTDASGLAAVVKRHEITQVYLLAAAGYEIKPGEHPILPIMIGDAVNTHALSQRILELGLYAVGFFFPVVPKGQARIRVQMSAVHERHHLEQAVAAFTQAGRELGLIGAGQ